MAEILENITYSEGVRYLVELSILNEKARSRLDVISDKKSDQEDSISQNLSIINSPSMPAEFHSSIRLGEIGNVSKSQNVTPYKNPKGFSPGHVKC